MEQREGRYEEFGGGLQKGGGDAAREVDARLAAWITSVSPAAAARYLEAGHPLPEPSPSPPGVGEGWAERAVADVLRACFARGLVRPSLEEVEVATLGVLAPPLPDGEKEAGPAGALRGRSPLERWERAVAGISRRAFGLLQNGPVRRAGEVREVLLCGGTVRASVGAACLVQRVDLLWRRADGGLGAVVIVEEPDRGVPPVPPAENWRVILAAETVRRTQGAIPEVHLLRVQAGVGQAVRPTAGCLRESIRRLLRAVAEATDPALVEGNLEEGFTYPLTPEAVVPLQHGFWPGGRARPLRSSGR